VDEGKSVDATAGSGLAKDTENPEGVETGVTPGREAPGGGDTMIVVDLVPTLVLVPPVIGAAVTARRAAVRILLSMTSQCCGRVRTRLNTRLDALRAG
jgi:hypothetical protein